MSGDTALHSSPEGSDETRGSGGFLRATGRFFVSRLRGEAPLRMVFYRDMLLFGTAINILSFLIVIVLVAAEASPSLPIFIFLTVLPWNLFLFFSVWQCADKRSDASGIVAKAGAALWLVAAIAL